METLNIYAIAIAILSIIWNVSIILAESESERLSLFVPYQQAAYESWKRKFLKFMEFLERLFNGIHVITALILICGIIVGQPNFLLPWIILSAFLAICLAIRWLLSIFWVLCLSGSSLWCIETAAIGITMGFYGLSVYFINSLFNQMKENKN